MHEFDNQVHFGDCFRPNQLKNQLSHEIHKEQYCLTCISINICTSMTIACTTRVMFVSGMCLEKM